MFDLPSHWVWDFWLTRSEDRHHLFFLKAPRSLGDPELRHRNASVGHATSPDLRAWTERGETIGPQVRPAYDDLAVWTGSVTTAPDGGWRMFTTGLSAEEDGLVQRIGASTSPDLTNWARRSTALLEADPRWYAVRGAGQRETHWRDPWVFAVDGTWHLVATARSAATGRAVLAHATSTDQQSWTVQPPISHPSRCFDWAEVPTIARIDRTWALVFSCMHDQMPGAAPGSGGVWSVPVPPEALAAERDPAGPRIDLDAARRLTSEQLYAGRVVDLPDGTWRFMAFRYQDVDGAFLGGVIDPVRVEWDPEGRALRLPDDLGPWLPEEELVRRGRPA